MEPKPKGGYINPSKICNNNNCPKPDLSGLIKSTTTGRTFIVLSKITCKFNNLIYLIKCKNCQSQYVGQTMNSIQIRFQKHLKDVDHCSNWSMAPPSAKAQDPTNVGLHFSQRHTLSITCKSMSWNSSALILILSLQNRSMRPEKNSGCTNSKVQNPLASMPLMAPTKFGADQTGLDKLWPLRSSLLLQSLTHKM